MRMALRAKGAPPRPSRQPMMQDLPRSPQPGFEKALNGKAFCFKKEAEELRIKASKEIGYRFRVFEAVVTVPQKGSAKVRRPRTADSVMRVDDVISELLKIRKKYGNMKCVCAKFMKSEPAGPRCACYPFHARIDTLECRNISTV